VISENRSERNREGGGKEERKDGVNGRINFALAFVQANKYEGLSMRSEREPTEARNFTIIRRN